MIRRPPRSTLDRSSAASDVYKRQGELQAAARRERQEERDQEQPTPEEHLQAQAILPPVSYTHLRAHETVLDLVCRLLLEKKKKQQHITHTLKITYHRKRTITNTNNTRKRDN